MTVLINPGSGPAPDSGNGWTNTAEGAQKIAEQWLANMTADGIRDITLLPGSTEHEGHWTFRYQHAVTGAVVQLETTGIDHLDAYRRSHIFLPRQYWNGSSTSEPEITDWLTDGHEIIKTIRPTAAADPSAGPSALGSAASWHLQDEWTMWLRCPDRQTKHILDGDPAVEHARAHGTDGDLVPCPSCPGPALVRPSEADRG
jgi:hypothetical protein